MHRIDGAGNDRDRFTEGKPGAGVPATVVTSDWLNAVQEEIVSVIEYAGIALSRPDNAQLAKALKRLLELSALQRDFGAVGDGAVNDTAAFSRLEGARQGQEISLAGSSYVVDALPSKNVYRDGRFVVRNFTYEAASVAALLSAAEDTGAYGPMYMGGLEIKDFSGRSTFHTRALLASQNCRSTFARSVNVGSIHCEANGNVSGNYSSRGSRANCPQSVNTASEECQVDGFRGINASAFLSRIEGLGGANLGTRRCTVSAKESVNLASAGAVAGQGKGARLAVTLRDGVVDSIKVVNGGTGYETAPTIQIQDRVGDGNGARATATVVAGSVVAVNVSASGRNYSSRVDATPLASGQYSANIATTNSCKTAQEACANIASNNSRAKAVRSANIAAENCETGGANAFNAGASNCVASASHACNVGSVNSTADAVGAVTIGGTNLEASAPGTVVFGRSTRSDTPNAIVYGYSPGGGAASTSNRKFQVSSTGNVQAAGTIAGSASFADYAEYFENLVEVEIPLGLLVTLRGAKVAIAQPGDAILGVVSATAMIVAGDSPFHWAHRYELGHFGEILHREILDPEWQPNIPDAHWRPCADQTECDRPTIPNPERRQAIRVPVENRSFDPTRPNVPRSERPREWTCVGILGQLHVRVDRTVRPGDQLHCGADGVATRTDKGSKLICMDIRLAHDPAAGYAVALCFLR